MATAKKVTKKSVTRAPAKSKTTTKVTHRAAPKAQEFRSFHRAPSEPFFTLSVTQQTLYWLILCGIILVLGIWVINVNVEIQQIYDKIDATNRMM